MAGIVSFMESPLMSWMRTFSDHKLITFQDVCDGVYFNDVLLQIYPKDLDDDTRHIHRSPADSNARLLNWNVLLHSIKAFYNDVLHQTVVSPIPDLLALVEDPAQAHCLEDMENVMLLLLGCAVQCDGKAKYIEGIMSLGVSTQQAIVEWIRKVTETTEHVISHELISGDSDVTKELYSVLQRVIKERDALFENALRLKQERTYIAKEMENKGEYITPPSSLEKYHLNKTLQDAKAQLAEATEELENKTKAISEIRDELQQQVKECNRVKSENLALSKDAKLARVYRDELDASKEQALRIEKYESELAKLREKNHEMDYLKTRIEELRDDNAILGEAKQKLEAHASALQKKIDSMMQDFVQIQNKLEELSKEKDIQQKRFEEVLEENAALDFERTRAKEGYSGPLRRMISYTSSEFLHGSNLQLYTGNPISEELSDSMSGHVTKLEFEYDKLKSEREEIEEKLKDTQNKLETSIRQSEQEYAKRLEEFTKEQSQLRNHLTDEITTKLNSDFDKRIQHLSDKAKAEKQQIVNDYTAKVEYLEKENSELRRKISLAKQKTIDTDKHVSQLAISKAENSFQCKIDELTTNYESQIKDLKQENERLQNELNLHHDRLTENNVGCEHVASDDLKGEYVERLTDREARLTHKHRYVENELQVKSHHLQKEKEDLKNELSHLQKQLKSANDNNKQLQILNKRLDREHKDMKSTLDSQRECSESHIKHLEQELVSLQTKAVAMENLNEYLNNMSTSDENVLDHSCGYSFGDENHNCPNVSKDSIRSLPADLQHLIGREHKLHAPDTQSLNIGMTTDNVGSPYNSRTQRYRGEKINYVKGPSTCHQLNGKGKSEIPKPSGSILGKLKNYVKTPKETEADQRHPKVNNEGRSNKSTREVQMREHSGFDRNSRMRHTIQNVRLKEYQPDFKPTKLKTPVVQSHSRPASYAFSRDHALRQTMPERKTTYHFPDKRTHSSRNSSQQSLLSHQAQVNGPCYVGDRSLRNNKCETSSTEDPTYCEIPGDSVDSHQRSIPPNPYHAHCDTSGCCCSDYDSGFVQQSESVSPMVNCDSGEIFAQGDKHNHKVTSIEILCNERTTKRFSSTSHNALIQQIVKLQDENISLAAENGELRKSVDTLHIGDLPENATAVAEKLKKLEVENKKLRMIIETLQLTLSGRSPYDKNKYHYFTNV